MSQQRPKTCCAESHKTRVLRCKKRKQFTHGIYTHYDLYISTALQHYISCLQFRAPTVWNKLPTGIRDYNTLHTFKHCLKHSSHLIPVNQRPHPRPPSDCPRLRFDVLYSTLCALQIIVL